MRQLWRLALVGTGLLLLLVSAPHEQPWDMGRIESALSANTLITAELGDTDFTVSADVLAQCASLLLLALMMLSRQARTSIRHLLSQPRQLPILAVALAYLLFTLKPSPTGWGIVLYLILGSLGMLLLFIGVWPLLVRLLTVLRGVGQRVSVWFFGVAAWKLVGGLALFTFTGTNLASYFIFEHIPHIQDSIGQVWHGRIFLLGRLTVPSIEPRAFFDFTHIINNGTWYSEYPPGHSLLMSFGHILHAPWVINPLFGAGCIGLLYLAGKEMYGERTARLSALLGSLSPFILFMSSEAMNHTTTLFFVLLFLLGFARLIQRGGIGNAVWTGVALGYALNIRPLTAGMVGVPFALYALVRLTRLGFRDRPQALRFGAHCLLALAAFGLFVGCFLGFNNATNGDPFVSGYVVLHGEGHDPGFGHSGWGEAHTPARGFTQTLNNLNALNKYLFEWPIPSLLFVVLPLLSARRRFWDVLLLAYPAAMAFGYFFYWFQDWCFGPRFMFASAGGLVLLTARGLLLMPDIARGLLGIREQWRVRGGLAAVLVFCFGLGLASNLPALLRLYSNSYWGSNGAVLKSVHTMDLQNALVFVRSYYGSVFPANDPLLQGKVIYARDLGDARNRELIACFPDRQYYVAEGSQVTKYEVR